VVLVILSIPNSGIVPPIRSGYLSQHRDWVTDWIDSQQVQEIFPFSIASRPSLRPDQRLIQYLAPRSLSPEVKRSGRKVDHPPSSSAQVKNVWSCTSISRVSPWRGAYLSTGTTFPYLQFFLGWGEAESTWYVGQN
jgi:hypothetical protein